VVFRCTACRYFVRPFEDGKSLQPKGFPGLNSGVTFGYLTPSHVGSVQSGPINVVFIDSVLAGKDTKNRRLHVNRVIEPPLDTLFHPKPSPKP
jgi:hypothetical protein